MSKIIIHLNVTREEWDNEYKEEYLNGSVWDHSADNLIEIADNLEENTKAHFALIEDRLYEMPNKKDITEIDGLKKAIEIIQEEKKYAIKVNPVMALGMSHIESLLLEKIKNKNE